MKIAIYTHYNRSDKTHAAILLAELFKEFGHSVDIRAAFNCAPNVSRIWDDKVITINSKSNHVRWWRNYDLLLWMDVPIVDDLAAVADEGVRTMHMCAWEDINPEDVESLSILNKLVFPWPSIFKSFKGKIPGMATGRDIVIPWAPFVISQAKSAPIPPYLLLFPLHRDQAARVAAHVFEMIEYCLREGYKVVLTHNGGWHIATVKRLKVLAKKYGKKGTQQFVIFKNPDEVALHQIYRACDLTVWASGIESYATVGMESLAAGTPVIAYDTPPHSDYLLHGKNSHLVPCEINESWSGMPRVLPNVDEFIEELKQVLQNNWRLAKITAQASNSVVDLRQRFLTGWRTLLQ